jgi:hypothetical protein
MKKTLFLLPFVLLVAVSGSAAPFDTIRCQYQEGPTRPTCHVLQLSSTGTLALVQEVYPDGDSALYFVSEKTKRQYTPIGPQNWCVLVSESGHGCRSVGPLVSWGFKIVNGVEVFDVVTTEARTRQDLCSNFVNRDYNEGTVSNGVKYVKESPDMAPEEGLWGFQGDPALRYQDDAMQVAVLKRGDYVWIYHHQSVASSPTAGTIRHWVLTNRFYAPGPTTVRYGTATYTRGSIDRAGQVNAGLLHVIEVRSNIGVRVYRPQDPLVLRASGSWEELALLPNGSVKPYEEGKCAEYF